VLYRVSLTRTMALIAVETNEAVATVTLNRPKALNAINRELFQELRQALHSLDGDKAIRVIVLTGAGKAFCAGADIAELSAMNGPSAFEQNFLRDWADCFQSVRTPIIAAVNGYAVGLWARSLSIGDFCRLTQESSSVEV